MYKIYVVEEGDTLISIAAKFNTTTEILNTINGKIPKIEKGTEIIVPNVTEIPFAIYKKGNRSSRVWDYCGLDEKEIVFYTNRLLLAGT